MRCVKCGQTISSPKCGTCGFDHSVGRIHFLSQPAAADLLARRQPLSEGVDPKKADVAMQYSLAKTYFNAENYEQAERWLLTPAKQGNRNAQYLLGYLYEVSDAHRNPDQAALWYGQAADRGEMNAADALIRLYRAAGPAKRDKLRYWEEKKRNMEQASMTAENKRKAALKASRDFVIKDGILVAYTGSDAHPVIPDGVIEIDADVFRGNERIRAVTVPEGVRKIGACAFAECATLRSVSLPGSLQVIESFAFADCPLEAIDLPAGLISLGEEGTFNSSTIRTVTIPGGVKTVPSHAFGGCSFLKEVVLQEGVTTIEAEAFENCGRLETIHIPDSVAEIADGSRYSNPPFYKCYKLSKVVASETWKRAHGDLLKQILPISAGELPWCREAANQGSLEHMRKLIHWHQTQPDSPENAEQLRKWQKKEDFVSWNDSDSALGNRYYWNPGEKDRSRWFERYLNLANQGDAYAQFWIGDCYFFGSGAALNQAEAAGWYQKSAAQGYAEAQYWLGYCYANGFGVETDAEKARYWLRKALQWFIKAAERGYSKAQSLLGECLFWGHAVTRNQKTAVSWFRKAAEQEYADAQYWLGICYSNGYGVEKNLAESRKWFLEAARGGHAGAMAGQRNNR